MKQTLECIEPNLYCCKYQISTGQWSTRFYGIFTDWKGKRRKIALGADLKIARRKLDKLKGDNAVEKDFDEVKPEPEPEPEIKPEEGMTVAKWSDCYFDLEEVKTKRSLNRDRQLVAHIKRHLGSKLLTDIEREDLFRYRNERSEEYIIRNGKAAKKKVSPGTIKLELSCLRRMVRLASQNNLKVSGVSFEGVLPTAGERKRTLSNKETKRLFNACPPWLRRLGEASLETCLSEGDLIRLTEDMIDEDNGVIVPDGGRCKTEVTQMAPLTERFQEIVSEIRHERKRSKVKNIGGLVFTREDGRPINKDMVTGTLKRVCKKVGIRDFRFHDFRHCAKTAWARRGIGVEAAMLAAGHASPQMHLHYIHLQRSDVAKAFGICSNGVQMDQRVVNSGESKS